jgi:alkanesulfonate monooxygenase SsuD/methylene tetrahydromethanopterin reductase-like flavin-dependent oxidoreductase (luciferase family)
MSKRGEWVAMAQRVDPAMVDTLAVHGTPEECATQIARRFEGVADRVCCYFPGYPIADERIGELVAAIEAT